MKLWFSFHDTPNFVFEILAEDSEKLKLNELVSLGRNYNQLPLLCAACEIFFFFFFFAFYVD